MGDKYIIELESGTHIFVLGHEGIVHIGEPDVVYETVDGMQIGDAVINAKPYTEPDLEQVRKEAYEEGYKTAKIQCGIQAEKDMREVGERHYQRGLFDAWEACKKIGCYEIDGGYPTTQMLDLFDRDDLPKILSDYTAAEAIEKIRQYEQENEEIKVGDEVTEGNHNACALYENPDGTQVTVLKQDGTTAWWCKSAIHRTGRHFPEIATVLEKMRGEQDG